MAMVSCKECGKGISSKAPVCPHCGAPQAKKRDAVSSIARIFLIIFVGVPIVGAYLFMQFAKQPEVAETHYAPAAAPKPAGPKFDSSAKAQSERETLFNDLRQRGVIHNLDVSGGYGHLDVTPAFTALPFEQKQTIASAAHAWAKTADNSVTMTNIRDHRDRKSLGSFTDHSGFQIK